MKKLINQYTINGGGQLLCQVFEENGRKAFYADNIFAFYFDGELGLEKSMTNPDGVWVFRYEVRGKVDPTMRLKRWALFNKADKTCMNKGLAGFGVSSKNVTYYTPQKNFIYDEKYDNGEFKRTYAYLQNGNYRLKEFDKIIEFSNGALFALKKWGNIGTIYSPDMRPIKKTYMAYEGYKKKNPDGATTFISTPNLLHFVTNPDMPKVNLMAIISADGKKILVDDKYSIRKVIDRIYYVMESEDAYGIEDKYHVVLTKDGKDLAVDQKIWSPTLIENRWIHFTNAYDFNTISQASNEYLLNTQFIGEFDENGKMMPPESLYSMDKQTQKLLIEKIIPKARYIQSQKTIKSDKRIPYWLGGRMMNDMLPAVR